MAAPLNYAESYQSALMQAYPYVLNFGALYNTPSNGRYRWTGARTIEIPTIATTGRVDSDRDTIGQAQRNYTNDWTPKTLTNQRKWSTLVHPMDIDQTNYIASISNITQVFNEEQKFPEMDAYCVSKIYADWTGKGKTANATVLTEENILSVFDGMMLNMSNKRVPATGRILYVTPATSTKINNAKNVSRTIDLKDGGKALNTEVSMINQVQIVPVPPELMMTVYNFTQGWQAGAGAKQINMMLIHPTAVITPVSYTFSQLDEPSAKTEGKYYYYEESFEDVFVLDNRVDAIEFNTAA